MPELESVALLGSTPLSIPTTLRGDLAVDAVTINITDDASFADPVAGTEGPYLICFDNKFQSLNPADYEAGTYTGVVRTGGSEALTGVVRAIESAQQDPWPSGTAIACMFLSAHIRRLNQAIIAHANLTNAHSPTAEATAVRTMSRDINARSKVADGVVASDIATKGQVDAKPSLGEASTDAYRGDRGKTAYDHSQAVTGAEHGAVSAATENMIIRRDAAGRAKVVMGEEAEDCVNKSQLDLKLNKVGGTISAYREVFHEQSAVSGAVTLNYDNGNIHNLLVTGNVTSLTITNVISIETTSIRLKILADGAYTYAWITPYDVISASEEVSASSVDNSYNSAAAFGALVKMGDLITITGFVNPANNGTFRVISATTSKIVVASTLVNAAAGAAVTITRAKAYFRNNKMPSAAIAYIPKVFILTSDDGDRFIIAEAGEF